MDTCFKVVEESQFNRIDRQKRNDCVRSKNEREKCLSCHKNFKFDLTMCENAMCKNASVEQPVK